MIGLGYESIHACVNDCFLFQGDANKDVHFCLVCKTSRWKDSNTPEKKVPKNVLCYFLIIPRLQRLYKSSHTAKEITWHATGKCTEPGKMQHPVDGRAWKNFDNKYLDFAEESRNVRLGLAADGFNPFGNLSKDIDVYLRHLIDDLKDLWAKPEAIDGGLIRPRWMYLGTDTIKTGQNLSNTGQNQAQYEKRRKIYNGKKAALKERNWVSDEDRTYDMERIRRRRPSHIFEVDWDAHIVFWNDPKNLARAAQNKQNRAKRKVMESSATREYSSLIHTFFLIHTVGSVVLNPEDKALYLESQPEYGGSSRSGVCGDDESGDDEDGGEDGEDVDDS
uniref:Uncharacterized protein n=1 Tax=Tanacetum cinerariifolium TaxID=118510 RepID=A0A6L2MCR8_TANCI|nr:hypothetical protein [Tanacetum cinerariifolium]